MFYKKIVYYSIMEKAVPNEEEQEMRRYALLSSLAYDVNSNGKKVAEEKMKEFLPYHSLVPELTDAKSSVIFKEHKGKPNDIIISYRGSATLEDAAVDVGQIATGSPFEKLGGIPIGRFKESQDKYDLVKEKYPDANITLSGHSLGGSLGYFIGKKNDVKSYIFNSGSSPLDLITEMGIKDNLNNKSTHYYIPGDVVGASKAVLGSSNDKLVSVEPKRWLVDVAKTFKSAAAGSIFGPIGAAVGFGIGIKDSILDLHNLAHFLPDETFKNKLDKEDIMYKYVKPIDIMLQQINNTKNIPIKFDSPIIKTEFFRRLKYCNPQDKLSNCYKPS